MNFLLLTITLLQGNPFIEKITSDYSENSYYLILCLSGSNQKIAIENNNLYVYMNRCKKINKRKYKNRMRHIYRSNKCIMYKDLCDAQYGIYLIKDIERVTYNKSLGMAKFIEFYFNDRVIKKGFTEEERFAVIAQLFEWQIPCYQDCESGYLMLDN